MNRYLSVLALSLMVLPTVIATESRGESHLGTASQQRACRPDVLRYCRGIRDDLAIADCLKTNAGRLHPACRRALEQGR